MTTDVALKWSASTTLSRALTFYLQFAASNLCRHLYASAVQLGLRLTMMLHLSLYVRLVSAVFTLCFSGSRARSGATGTARPSAVRRQAQDVGAAHRGVLPALEEQHQGVSGWSYMRTCSARVNSSRDGSIKTVIALAASQEQSWRPRSENEEPLIFGRRL